MESPVTETTVTSTQPAVVVSGVLIVKGLVGH